MINQSTNPQQPESLPTLPDQILRQACEVEGLDCSTALDAFTDLLLPTVLGTSRPALRATLAMPFGRGGISTCALVASAIHLRAGFAPAELQQRYRWGDAVSRIVRYIMRSGLWRQGLASDNLPPPASCLIIGCRSPGESYGGIEHVLTVKEWQDDVLVSIDGGQVDAGGLQAIRTVRRRLLWRSGAPWLVHPDLDPKRSPGRRIFGWGLPQ